MARVTHKISDRPLPSTKASEKPNHSKAASEKLKEIVENAFETVQPQWVFDCVNFECLLPVDRYALGVVCPDHLSPFVEGVTKDHIFEGGGVAEK